MSAHPAGQPHPDPDTWLWLSIFSTVCCCLPFGVVGIVFAAMAKGALNSGDYVTAERHAANARGWTIAAIVIGLIVAVCYGASSPDLPTA